MKRGKLEKDADQKIRAIMAYRFNAEGADGKPKNTGVSKIPLCFRNSEIQDD